MDTQVLPLFTGKNILVSSRFYWSPQGSVTSIHQEGRSTAPQMPCAALTVGNFCRALKMSQNSKKFVNVWEIPSLISGREKGKLGMAWSISNLQSTIYVALLTNVLSGVMQNGKWSSSLSTFLQFPVFMLLLILSCLRSTRSFNTSVTFIIRNFYFQFTEIQLFSENRGLWKT